MAKRFLMDTSAVIKYLNGTLSAKGLSFMDMVVANERVISFISEIELQSWNPYNPDALKIYQFFISNSVIIGINSDIIKETVRIRKFFKLKLPDALIAASAIINELTLIADNDKDFRAVPELNYINPNTISVELQ